MKCLSKFEWGLLAFILVYSFVPTFGGLLRVLELAGGPALIPENPRALSFPVPIVVHIVSSFLFCLVGAVQFLPNIRRHYPSTHHLLGRVVVASGCVSAASGLWMTHMFVFPEPAQGTLLYWVRVVLGAAMLGFIGWAVIAIRSRNIFQHSAFMLRAYAIGQGASTQTMLGISWMIILGTDPLGPARDVLMVSAWGLNLLATEVVIWRFLRPRDLTARARA